MTQAQSARPTGTVTFLFSDIEGSTGRWEAEPEAMREAVGRHDALLHDVFASGGGYVFKTVGDAFCVAFGDPLAAFRAALAAQQRLADEAFEAVGGLRVRIGMHTGAADERDGDYFGPTVNRVARLSDAGHGGQILVSGITAELVRDARLPGVTLLELGEYRLRDLAAPERIFQACGQGLERAFPPLRTGGAVRSNLPATPSSFVGRARELALIAESLEAHRLVTITGAGGVGKTRLALAAAAPLVPTFSGGVWFVDLSPLASPAVVIDEFAAVLGIRPSPGASLLENLAAALRTRHALLVVDNCEHVIDAAAACVAHLLRHCPNVHVLATSREALQVAGERQVTLAPLEVPEREPVADAGDALAYSAVALLVERATAAGRFALSDANAGAVAEIARRLDGIPFALELAAPRLAVISPAKMLELLAEPLR
ncbi:MAG: ATP-binding protein, partial [Candidatus Dormibacteria bacterium]